MQPGREHLNHHEAARGRPLNPAEVGEMLGLVPAAASDAALITGGLPLICAEWTRGAGMRDFLRTALADPVSAIGSGERAPRVHTAVEGPPLPGCGPLPALLAEVPGSGDGGDRARPGSPDAAAHPRARTNDVEIDVVGADRAPVAEELLFVGSVKWLENSPFDRHNPAALHRHRAALIPTPVPVIAISRSGTARRTS